MTSPAIAVSGLTLSLDGHPVLPEALDLEVQQGEHVLLVGRSGCGKTSLLRAIAGLVPLSSGTIQLSGQPVNDGPKVLVDAPGRKLGYLPQGGALWPHLSVSRCLDFVLKLNGVDRACRQARVKELLAMVELAGLEDRLPSTLSGGEAQRVALARALAVEPRVLLLDEPLGPLDAELRSSLLERLDRVRRELDLAVLHVTHDPREAAPFADRTLRLRDSALSVLDTVAS